MIFKPFSISSDFMSHNVQGWRRLGQVIGQCGALTHAPNVVEQNATKAGFSPTTGVLRNPNRRTGGER